MQKNLINNYASYMYFYARCADGPRAPPNIYTLILHKFSCENFVCIFCIKNPKICIKNFLIFFKKPIDNIKKSDIMVSVVERKTLTTQSKNFFQKI